MAYLKTIVDFINAAIVADFLTDDCFESKMIGAIAQPLPRQKGDKVEWMPALVDDAGEATFVGPDDDYAISIYHKVNGITTSKEAKSIPGYGDDLPKTVMMARMSLVVSAFRDQIELSNDEVALFLVDSMPQALSKTLMNQLKFKTGNIIINEIILNNQQVFQEEFQGFEYFLKPFQYLIKINYSIESAFQKGCFTKYACP